MDPQPSDFLKAKLKKLPPASALDGDPIEEAEDTLGDMGPPPYVRALRNDHQLVTLNVG
jgi:hypothetical protein